MRRRIHQHQYPKKKKKKNKPKIKPKIFHYHKTNLDKVNNPKNKFNKINNPLDIPKPSFTSHFHKPMVNLGCLNANIGIQDIVPININWTEYQNPKNFSTGSGGPRYALLEGEPVKIDISQTNNKYSTPTPLQSSVTLTGNVNLYNIAATANGFGSVTLSQEGLLWTLWPLAKGKNKSTQPYNYFNDFTFGTSLSSNYPIGQVGYFYNNYEIACTPMTSAWVNPDPSLPPVNPGQPGMAANSPPMLPGIQGFAVSLLYTTSTQIALLVIKVSEEIARIFNPAAGIGSSDRFIYVGYDAWSIFRTTFNPVGPMMTQTYITPQSVTGTIVDHPDNILENNYNVVIPPNFPQTIYFKQKAYIVPNNANLFIS